MLKRAIATSAVVALLFAPTLHSQQPGQPAQESAGRMGHGMMCMGMMGIDGHMGAAVSMMSGMPSPAMILRASEAISLTPEQKTRLEAIRTQSTETVESHMQQAMAARHKAMRALQGDSTDLAAYEAAVKEAAGQMAAIHVAAAQASVDARAVLTPDQRARLTDALTMVREMMSGASGGMMMPRRRGSQ